MNQKAWTLRVIIVSIAIFALTAIVVAQGGGGDPENVAPTESLAQAGDVAGGFTYQGVLTEGGAPVNENRNMQFKLFDASSGGNQVGATLSKTVPVHRGQFNVFLTWGRDRIDGKALWLQVQAQDSHGVWRNLGRTPLSPVPYAMSLKPGAWVRTTSNLIPYALFLHHQGRGAGLRVKSESGPAIDAQGTGVIKSSAKSYLWISGNDLRPKNSADSTQFEMDIYGGVKVRRGSVSGPKDVILPVTIPGQLYGQDVKVTGIDVYLKSQGDFDGITRTAVRRQTRAGSGKVMVTDDHDHVCTTACSYHLDIASNNVLSDDQGVVYIAFRLVFGGASNYVQIGGVRLTLEHD